jgi:hypothetical protein
MPRAPEQSTEDQLPGIELKSGFRMRRADAVPSARLNDEARERVTRKIDSVDAARLHAAREGHTAYIG